MILLDIELPGLPPTVNHVYRTSRISARYKTAEGKAYQEQAIALMNDFRKMPRPYEGRVSLSVWFWSKDRRWWDVDNRIKVLQDCLAPAGILKNDKQIVELHARRVFGTEDRTHIVVGTLANWQGVDSNG